jgi:hypothetical protein
VIRDLSLTLQAVLADDALASEFPELHAALVAFERPSDSFSPTATTLDLFLFDIRENLELRSGEPSVQRERGQVTLAPPPLRVACSYLVTAWPVGGGDLALQEHLLLGQALPVLARYPQIPARYLRGALVDEQPPLPMRVAQAGSPGEPHEFWAAIGNKMRAAFVVTVTVGMKVFADVAAQEVIVSAVRIGPPATPARYRIGGRVTNAAGLPMPDAVVRVEELGLVARTDWGGRFQVGAMPEGKYVLGVQGGSRARSVTVMVPPKPGSNYDVQV